MAAFFDQLDRCEFNGIAFPVEEISIVGRARRHVHEYPHAPGGATEKLGRGVYIFRIRTLFDEDWNDRYPNLYPDNLEKLFAFFEQQTTGGLYLPTLGKVDAWCTSWNKTMSYAIRSGERVEFEFEEDQSQLFLIDALLAAAATTIEVANDALLAAVEEQIVPLPNIFEVINDAVTSLLAIRDQADLQWSFIESKALAVVALIDEADRTVPDLQHPEAFPIIEAMKEIAASAQQLVEDAALHQTPVKTYVTPKRSTIADVSTAIYGTTERALELLQFNDIVDAFDIQANVQIQYYDGAAA